MKIHSIYRFKLIDSANKIFRLSEQLNSYSGFGTLTSLRIRYINEKGLVKKCKLISDNEFQAKIQLVNDKYGIGIIEESNDLLIINKSIDRLGLLRIYVFENMKPYSAIIFQSFIDGYFNSQISELRKSLVQ